MTRLYVTIGSVLAALSLLAIDTPTALACSDGADFDPVAQAEVIVSGRITGWTRLGPAPPTAAPGVKSSESPFTPILVHIAVVESFKGEVSNSLDFADGASLLERGGESLWAGASGACGVFDEDPTDQYVVLGLSRSDEGSYGASRPLAFYVGDEPSGEWYQRSVSLFSSLGLQALPAGGGAPTGARSSEGAVVGIIVAVAGASMMQHEDLEGARAVLGLDEGVEDERWTMSATRAADVRG